MRRLSLSAGLMAASLFALSPSHSSAQDSADDAAIASLFADDDSGFVEDFSVGPMRSSFASGERYVGLYPDFDEESGDVTDPSQEKIDTLENRIAELEASLKKLDSSWTKFDDGEKKKKSDASKKPTMKINGRIHADFWSYLDTSPGIGFFENPTTGADPEDLFAFRRIRLEIAGDIPDNMLYRLQVDFNNPSTPEMKDVYLGFKELPGNQTLLIGNQKRPLGLDHLNSSRNNVFIERPLVIETFNSDARRPGICMHGESDDSSMFWSYGAFYLEQIATDGRYFGDSRQMSGNARLGGSPWYDESTDGRGYFHWAVAGMVAKPDGDVTAPATNSNEGRFATRAENRSISRWLDTGKIPGADWYETLAVESILNVGPTQLVGEYQTTFMQRDGFSDTHFHGGYVYLSYFLTGEHIPYDRSSGTIGRVIPYENFFLVDRGGDKGHGVGWGALNVAARYSYLDISDKDVLGGVGNEGTLAINWFWNPFAKVQFDLGYGTIDHHAPVGGYTSGDFLQCGTRFAVDF